MTGMTVLSTMENDLSLVHIFQEANQLAFLFFLNTNLFNLYLQPCNGNLILFYLSFCQTITW